MSFAAFFLLPIECASNSSAICTVFFRLHKKIPNNCIKNVLHKRSFLNKNFFSCFFRQIAFAFIKLLSLKPVLLIAAS